MSNAAGERRPTGKNVRHGEKRTLWAVSSTGLLGSGGGIARPVPFVVFSYRWGRASSALLFACPAAILDGTCLTRASARGCYNPQERLPSDMAPIRRKTYAQSPAASEVKQLNCADDYGSTGRDRSTERGIAVSQFTGPHHTDRLQLVQGIALGRVDLDRHEFCGTPLTSPRDLVDVYT